jgi:hypothetical protein
MKVYFFSFALFAVLLVLNSVCFATTYVNQEGDTTVVVFTKSDVVDIQIINQETPIIIKKGEVLKVDIENPKNQSILVRVHSSLGRLVKQFDEVYDNISMKTDVLLPGVYIIVIKRAESREIRKFLLTE